MRVHESSKKIIYQQVLDQIEAMKAGANFYAVGFHEKVEREMRNGRGRFGLVEEMRKKGLNNKVLDARARLLFDHE